MTRNNALTVGTAAFLAIACVSFVAGQQAGSPYPPAKPQALAAMGTPARGEQLVVLGGCHDCHTPKLQNGAYDMSRALSGQPENAPLPPNVIGGVSANMMLTAWRGPWGVSQARNITSDKQTGIGGWTLADFKKTLRTGVDPKGDVLMPPMPIQDFQNLPEKDLETLYAYLRTVKPIHNTVGHAMPPQK
jgi:mono/diheme cytochrome c family protein